jgi:hypothetical protein
MELQLVIENKRRRERPPRPVKEIVDEDFNLFVKKEKWNIASVLSRLAPWDERRQLFTRKPQRRGPVPPAFIDEGVIDLINRSLLPYY